MDATTSILYDLGITPNLKGFDCIRYAVFLIIDNKEKYSSITKTLYPDVAKTVGSNAYKVERNIRHAISKAIKADHGEMKNLIGISPYKNNVTNSEFLFALAYRVENEREV